MRFRFGRHKPGDEKLTKAAHPVAPRAEAAGAGAAGAVTSPAGTGKQSAGVGKQEAGHALRAPSKLHAFNRFEVKYLVPREMLGELRDELRHRMDVDSYAAAGGYGVWSVYYDTTHLRFYWEKVEGLRFRRKIRVRYYGDRFSVTDDAPVFVEIKQRVNRVTQKRRVRVPYWQARRLCDERREIEYSDSGRGFLDEVLGLINGLDLRPIAMTGYSREAYIGRDADVGLRVTLDHRVRGRDRDLHFAAETENRFIIPPRLAVLEVKANERVPYWLTDLTATRNLSVARVSKYCQSIEVYGRAPRSAFHVPVRLHDPVDGESPATTSPPAPATIGMEN